MKKKNANKFAEFKRRLSDHYRKSNFTTLGLKLTMHTVKQNTKKYHKTFANTMQISQNQGSSWSWLCDWPYWPQHVVNSELHIHTLVLNCHAYDMVLDRALNKFCCNLCQQYQPYICSQLLFLHWIHPNTAPYILLSLATRPHIVKQNSTPDIYSFGTEAGFLKKLA